MSKNIKDYFKLMKQVEFERQIQYPPFEDKEELEYFKDSCLNEEYFLSEMENWK